MKTNEHEVILAIVNAGFAEEVMEVARENGVRGGTILNARGVVKEDAAAFFGITLHADKEILMMVVEKAIRDKVPNAIYQELAWLDWVAEFFYYVFYISAGLAVFNLLPIPPLDGYHLLNDTLLRGRLQLSPQAFRITHLALMVLMFSGMLGGLLSKANLTLYHAVLNMFLMLTGGA